METGLEFLKHYHNNLPNDWLFEKRKVVAKLLEEYAAQKEQRWKPCGEGVNICNCKQASECGYIEIYAGIGSRIYQL